MTLMRRGKEVGYHINFGRIGKVDWKRFVLSEFIEH